MQTITAAPRLSHLIQEFYVLWGEEPPELDAPDEDSVHFEIEVDEVRFELLQVPRLDSGTFVLRCVLGELPAHAAPALQRALEINHLTCRIGGPVLGIDPFKDQMVMSLGMSLYSTDASALVATVSHMAAQAMRWRHDPLLEGELENTKGSWMQLVASLRAGTPSIVPARCGVRVRLNS